MTVQLNVRNVRDYLWSRTRPIGTGPRSNIVLGTLFHEVASELCGSSSRYHLIDLLAEHGDRSSKALLRVTYEKIVGPRLTAAQAQLATSSSEVLHFWSALESLLEWLKSLGMIARDKVSHEEAKRLFASEERVSARFRQPGWTDEVEVTGLLDLILRVPEARWCVIELKLGKGSPEADLTQACLYHVLLSGEAARSAAERGGGTLALVDFRPEKSERVLDAGAVARLREPLLDLIGELAGVARKPADAPASPPASSVPAPPEASTWEPMAKKLTQAFREYGVELKLKPPTLGPAFLRFPVELGRAQPISKLSANTENVQVRVGLRAPPLVTVDDGRAVIDVERTDRQTVRFASVRNQIAEAQPRGAPLLAVGVDQALKMRFANLADPLNCHVLVAGTTGSGKSEWLRFALAGIALRFSPDQVRFVLIDPKRNAFLELRNSPYLHGEHGLVFPGEHSIHDVLGELADEMERRYSLFSKHSADDLQNYTEKTKEKIPRILVVCDEYYDLVAAGGKEQKAVEGGIGRLGAKARAAGIHLILATQQPSRQVIGGAIQANIPCRVGLKAQNAIESRMILREPGAEALLGHGDLLFRDVGQPVRLQAPLTTPDERRIIFDAR